VSDLSSFINNTLGITSANQAAAAAQQQEQMLQQQQAQQTAAIQQGQQAIDSAFSQFTPSYYSGVTSAYDNAYQPQLTNQYNTAKDQLVAQLAGNGTLQSTVGANALSQLEGTYNTDQAQINDQGVSAAENLQNTVSNDETNLYNMNQASADPSASATQAQAQAGALVAPQSYPTLSNMFSAALAPAASATKAATNSLYAPAAIGPTASAPSSSAASIS
jgi:hypothetical protein